MTSNRCTHAYYMACWLKHRGYQITYKLGRSNKCCCHRTRSRGLKVSVPLSLITTQRSQGWHHANVGKAVQLSEQRACNNKFQLT